MLTHPNFDPVAFELGSIRVHWYGIMYLIAFLTGWGLGIWRTRDAFRGWTRRDMDDVLFYVALGIIVGGRVGYVLFYATGQFLENPLMIVQVWQGGMSFHGGLLGTMFAMWLFARRRYGGDFFKVADFIAPLVPLGLGAGRIGNFINGNLWGKTSDVPWAMVFPGVAAGDLPRHPSQLYEALLEGLVLFIIVWLFSRRPRPLMSVSGVFLLGYGIFRFLIEFVRVPDAHLGYLAFDWLTMGHLLTLPMIVGGAALLWWGYQRGRLPEPLIDGAAAQDNSGRASRAEQAPKAQSDRSGNVDASPGAERQRVAAKRKATGSNGPSARARRTGRKSRNKRKGK